MINHRALKRLQIKPGRGIRIGVVAGFVGILISLPLRTFFPGRLVGDPMPTMLILNQVLRSGLLYIQWQPLLFHFLFLLILIGLSWGISILFPQMRRDRGWFIRSTRVAVLLNVLIAALFEVDSIMIGLWYFVSGYLSLTITSLLAGKVRVQHGRNR